MPVEGFQQNVHMLGEKERETKHKTDMMVSFKQFHKNINKSNIIITNTNHIKFKNICV